MADRAIELPLPGQATTTPETRFEKGREEHAQIISAERVALLYWSARADQQHIQRYLSANWFDQKGLEITLRELLTFSMVRRM